MTAPRWLAIMVWALLVAGCEGEDSLPAPRCGDGASLEFAFAVPPEEFRHTDVAGLDRDRNLRVLTDDHASYDADFSPDGDRIVFVTGRDGEFEECCGFTRNSLYVMNADGTNESRLTHSRSDGEPAWSPDGTKIAFTRGDYWRNRTIYVIDANGGSVRRVVPGRKSFTNAHPTWAPDSRSLAFVSRDGNGRDRIWIVDADGSDPYPLGTPELRAIDEVEWSPDGKRLAVAGWKPRTTRSLSVTIEIDSPSRRHFISYYARGLSWSADGERIAYLYSHQPESPQPALRIHTIDDSVEEDVDWTRGRIFPEEFSDLSWLDCKER